MTPSPPLTVSVDTDLRDVTCICKNCGATTTHNQRSGISLEVSALAPPQTVMTIMTTL
jgi:hypothetical protein